MNTITFGGSVVAPGVRADEVVHACVRLRMASRSACVSGGSHQKGCRLRVRRDTQVGRMMVIKFVGEDGDAIIQALKSATVTRTYRSPCAASSRRPGAADLADGAFAP